jgi:hypothetical protein
VPSIEGAASATRGDVDLGRALLARQAGLFDLECGQVDAVAIPKSVRVLVQDAHPVLLLVGHGRCIGSDSRIVPIHSTEVSTATGNSLLNSAPMISERPRPYG